jgi:putative NADH-flavin reductase
MQISVLGATGRIGRRIVDEALRRKHTVTAVARGPSPENAEGRVTPKKADVTEPSELEAVIQAHDAVVSAVGPAPGTAVSMVVDTTRALAAAAMRTRVKRLVIVGGAGSLAVEPGLELLHTPDFPKEFRDIALAHREALEIWRRVKELDWTYVSPAASIEPGARTGKYRVGHNDLLIDEAGQSRISMEDFAVAVLDEVENNSHVRERINVAY